TACVVSCGNLSQDTARLEAGLSQGWPKDLLREDLAQGASFTARTIDYGPDFVASVGDAIDNTLASALLARGPARIRIIPAQVKHDPVPVLSLLPTGVQGKITLSSFEAALDGAEILLPLDFDRGVEPGIRLRGTLILDIPGRAAPARLEAEAAFALWT